ncbi:MAG: DUF1638 domain-containing protein [Armatimonadetes bacterium]|nr:DUF1638 domain-containing protein [Armatimonadota bacterium]
MKYRVIACGVFEPYLRQLAAECGNEIDVKPLDAGLHSRPNDLRLLVQTEIDEASRSGDYDAILLFYGLCGRGMANLVARNIPVVIPRAHDCITIFLGSSEAYLRQFHKNPGTFYHTLGWIEKKTNPKNREASELYRNYHRDGYAGHPEYDELKEQYGEENAEHIIAFTERWKQHYSRAAYIDMGFSGEEPFIDFTRQMAESLEWKHEIIDGDPMLMRSILEGDWTDDRIFVLPPGHRSLCTGDDRIFSSAAVDAGIYDSTLSDEEIVIEAGGAHGESTGIGLGIDAGGTYTDAVIYDLGEHRLLAKSKALTTYHNLLDGIREALDRLPKRLLRRVQITSLSTTLATNSIVEGRGHKVGLIVLAPWDWFGRQIGHKPCVRVPGAVSITGEEMEPLDEDACRRAVRKLINRENCAAIVIAGYATVRNPTHANRARAIVSEMSDVPVICAHEVSRRLNSIHGAQTAVANAKLLPIIRDLIESVHQALSDFQVAGKLMVVKGDGTPVDESIARARPIETILSGPAASASGAKILTGLDDALVVDIGGTTTDCAILENGHVSVAADGARIGSETMSVDVVDICTVGLGGDSRIGFTRDRKITIGPVRNVPISYLASQYKQVKGFLNDFDEMRHAGAYDASAMDILVRSGKGVISPTDREAALLELIQDGPVSAIRAADALDLPSPSLLPTSRLEASGILKRSSLTPTDMLHAAGRFTMWDVEAAKRALEIFSAMFGRPAEEVLELALRAVTRRLFEEIVRREVSSENHKIRDLPEEWDFLFDKAFSDDGIGLGVRFEMRRPIVAIGAPAEALALPVKEHLSAEIIIPEHSDVANAIGAIASEVVVREEIIIRPGQMSNYVLHGAEECLEFAQLSQATEAAAGIAGTRACRRALEAGAAAPEVTVSRNDRIGTTSDLGRVLLERKVTAVASGGAFWKRR